MTTNETDVAPDRPEGAVSSGRLDCPIFVGGTGRSGTTLTARLLGASCFVHSIPIEIRFHVDPDGLTDVIDGRVEVDRFIRKMHTHWYRRTAGPGEDRGLHLIMGERELREATAAFSGTARIDDSVRAARRLMGDLLDPLARENGAARWVEMTPPNVSKMRRLREIHPDGRFVHVYRDGRDVAHSVAALAWGPHDTEGALKWWEQMFVEALREMRGIEEAVLLVSMEDLVVRRRAENLARLFDFLGLPIDTRVESYFEQSMTLKRAHVGRWNRDLSSSERRETNLRYDAAVERIATEFPSVDLRL